MVTLPSLSDKIKTHMNLAGFSERTQEIYFSALIRCKKYFLKSLITVTKLELEDYFSNLISQNSSQSSIRICYSALKFLFTKVYNQSFPLDFIPGGKKKRKLPVVFDIQEVKDLLNVTRNIKHRAILSVTYSGGLRVNETRHLKVEDIDSQRMTIKVNQGKGKKDRYTILSQMTLQDLRRYFSQCQPTDYLFPGHSKDSPLGTRSFQYILKRNIEKAGIQKNASFHTLRHSFATHLYESGVGLAHIQKLLGHTSIKTTMIYVHLANSVVCSVKSPLDS